MHKHIYKTTPKRKTYIYLTYVYLADAFIQSN